MLAGMLLFTACAPESDEELILRDDYLGVWSVNETTGNNAPQFYNVNITAGSGENDIIINGLYNVSSTEVSATVDQFALIIPQQQSSSISFVGDGFANTEITRITLEFTANDGTGDDEVTAVLTP